MSRESSPNALLTGAFEDWKDLEKEYSNLEEDHKKYCELLAKLSAAQKKCLNQIAHHRYRIKCIGDILTRTSKTPQGKEEKNEIVDLRRKIAERKINFHEMEDNLPHKNGPYLRVILGEVNVSLLTKEAKFIYKKEYETFKVKVSYIILAISFAFISGFLAPSRWGEAVLSFLLVWYYCTLTIRESILKVNGSKIKGWWLMHHFISTVGAAICLIWPDGFTYNLFRDQHILFVFYTSFVYVLQFYYQSGCLYRLRSLGESHEMDITVEGFMSWMWKGLSFLLPFLFIGYLFQLYNAYVLFKLAQHPHCSEWQVLALSVIDFVLFVGNTSTTCLVLVNKIKSDGFLLQYLKNKYKFTIGNFLSQGHVHAD